MSKKTLYSNLQTNNYEEVYMSISPYCAFLAVASQAMAINCLPDNRLSIGMPFPNVQLDFPEVKLLYANFDENNQPTNALALVKFLDNGYWDSALLNVEKSIVESLSYVCVNQNGKSASTPHDILDELIRSFELPNDCFIVYNLNATGRVKSPAYAWVKEFECIIFTHLPQNAINSGESPRCRMTIIKGMEYAPKFFDIVSEYNSEDSKLFDQEVLSQLRFHDMSTQPSFP